MAGRTYTPNLHIPLLQGTDHVSAETFNLPIKEIDKLVLGKAHIDSRMHWAMWKKETKYDKGDVVRTEILGTSQYLECVVAGTSDVTSPTVAITGTQFTDGTAKWIVRALGGDTANAVKIWQGGMYMTAGQLILHNNNLYRVKKDHTSASDFNSDFINLQTLFNNVRLWSAGDTYSVNDSVIYNGGLYQCIKANSDFEFTSANWKLVGTLIMDSWQANQPYTKNQLVEYQGKIYRALSTHTSGQTFSKADWDNIYSNIPPWKSLNAYEIDDQIVYDNVLYVCIKAHNSSSTFDNDVDNWKILHNPTAFIKDWDKLKHYWKDQVVRYNNLLYRCKVSTATLGLWVDTDWECISIAITDWVSKRYYEPNMSVCYNGGLYQCVIANNDTNFTPVNWKRIGSGALSLWETKTAYVLGDTVIHDRKLYRCITPHTSKDFAKEYANWELISPPTSEWVSQYPYQVGDMVIVDGNLYYCKTAHTSTTDIYTDMANWTPLSQDGTDEWKTKTYYFKNQLVTRDGTLYRANVSHTSTTFKADTSKWDNMQAQIQSYIPSKFYKKDELVVQDNKLWKAKVDTDAKKFQMTKQFSNLSLLFYSSSVGSLGVHEFSTPHEDIQDLGSSVYINKLGISLHSTWEMYWTQIDVYISSDNVEYTFMGTAIIDTSTMAGNVVVDSTAQYIKLSAKSYHTTNMNGSGSGEMSVSELDIYADGDWEQLYNRFPTLLRPWASHNEYEQNELVYHENLVYRVKKGFTSGANFDITDLELLNDSYIEDWQPDKYYAKNQCVTKDDILLRSTVSHTSDSTFSSTEESQWEYILGGGNNGISQWETATKYQEGNVVLKNNTPYISNTNHTSNTFADDFQKWDLTYSNIRDWEPDVFYHKGSLVVHNDAIFQANTPHLSVDFATDIGAVFQTTEPYGYDYTAISPNLVVVFKEETDLTGFLILQSEKTRTNGASLTTVDVDITDSNNVTKTVKVTVGTKLEVTEKATSIKFKNPIGVNGSVTEYVNQTSLILVYGKDASCWTSLINPNKITKKQIDALF